LKKWYCLNILSKKSNAWKILSKIIEIAERGRTGEVDDGNRLEGEFETFQDLYEMNVMHGDAKSHNLLCYVMLFCNLNTIESEIEWQKRIARIVKSKQMQWRFEWLRISEFLDIWNEFSIRFLWEFNLSTEEALLAQSLKLKNC
jgi:hypothetical protein